MPVKEAKLLLIEDDPFLIEWLQRLQNEHFPTIKIIPVKSEREFLTKKGLLAESAIHGIILDWMLPWEDGVKVDSTDFTSPRGEHFDAGKRIIDDIYDTPRLAALPLLIYSANDPSALDFSKARQSQTTFMRKDSPDRDLIQWVRRLM